MSVKDIFPLSPLLYRKIGVYRGLPIFLVIDPKYKLKWL